jgi:hypothetical protein
MGLFYRVASTSKFMHIAKGSVAMFHGLGQGAADERRKPLPPAPDATPASLATGISRSARRLRIRNALAQSPTSVRRIDLLIPIIR